MTRHRPRPSDRWHLDEMVVRIADERMYLWRAVDHEGEVLDMVVQRRRDRRAALRPLSVRLEPARLAPSGAQNALPKMHGRKRGDQALLRPMWR